MITAVKEVRTSFCGKAERYLTQRKMGRKGKFSRREDPHTDSWKEEQELA